MDAIWLPFLFTFLASIGGGIVQATTGFGYGIFCMIFFPLYMPLLKASALSQAISLFLLATLAWRYRRYARVKDVIAPSVIYLIVSTSVILLAPGFDMKWMSVAFASLMILLSIYMLCFSQRMRIRANLVSAFCCSGLSGVASGLFGIGGPPMTLYYMALHGYDKYVYLGTLECFFLITCLANNVTRLASGLLSADVLLLVIPGVLGQGVGMVAGNWIVKRISTQHFKYLVYGFLAISGVVTILTTL